MGELGELTEESNIENCFEMIQPSDNSTHCTLKMTLKSNRKCSGIQILSEVAIFEVYGDYGEYISTTKGDLLDDVEGSCLYECRMDFKKPQSEILLKCLKSKDRKSLWIYGISIATQIAEVKPTNAAESAMSSLLLGMKTPRQSPNNVEIYISRLMEERIVSHIDKRIDSLEIKIEESNGKLMEIISE